MTTLLVDAEVVVALMIVEDVVVDAAVVASIAVDVAEVVEGLTVAVADVEARLIVEALANSKARRSTSTSRGVVSTPFHSGLVTLWDF